jgi:hypothetical protein
MMQSLKPDLGVARLRVARLDFQRGGQLAKISLPKGFVLSSPIGRHCSSTIFEDTATSLTS